MVSWYKRDIPKWMDGTEGLSDGAYRAYDVIVNLIYLNEEPIKLNEHGIAGRCKQSVRAFRSNLKELLDAGKLTLEDGRLRNSRADFELGNVAKNRENAARGGEKSGESRRNSKAQDKSLKDKGSGEAPLFQKRTEKNRLEETREEDSSAIALGRIPNRVRASKYPPEVEAARKAFHDRARVLKLQGSQVEQLLKAHGFHESSSLETMLRAIQKGRKDLEASASARVPRTYLAAIIRRLGDTEAAQSGVNYDPAF